ncbi:suppressor APC domain-containing protein 2 [Carassius carassius]|uniref:suppressor APC domain-containing protein 2 n=1 Tax=Carassius carassius TaxID=217509 RepID=UPI002868A126|nr:suppressor APC domain-containing protein 2 [Carassius carassius]
MALIQTDSSGKGNGLANALQSGVRKVCPSSKIANMQPKDTEFSTQGLPKAFLHSLRTLFDILDDGRRGYVHISEIESRWRGAEARDLPAGVLESLRRVAPRHGCLSFERFVAGLRNAMFNPENGSRSIASDHQHQLKPQQRAVRPLGPSNATNTLHSRQNGPQDSSVYSTLYPGLSVTSRGCGGLERTDCSYRCDPIQPRPTDDRRHPERRTESGGLPRSKSETMTGFTRSRRHARSRDERRHTITNGVDYGMLKQMKELEQEKDSLLAGLDVLERAREWYQTQIHNITETQRHIGQSRHSTEFLAESGQSHLDVVLPKLQDVTRCLRDLLSFSGETLSPTGSSSTPPAPPAPAPPQAIHILKEQNRLLTQEVTEKSERITQLEQEKSALIKQLFEARARSAHDSSALDSTFI